jgi:hypothetical protein
MTFDFRKGQEGLVPAVMDRPPGYQPPAVVVLGSVFELTQLGTPPTDELLNDGSSA